MEEEEGGSEEDEVEADLFDDGVGGVDRSEAAAGDIEVPDFGGEEGDEEGAEEEGQQEGSCRAVAWDPEGDGAEEFAPWEDVGEWFGGGPRDDVIVLDGCHETAGVGDLVRGGGEEDEGEQGSEEEADQSGHARNPPSSR